MLEAACDDIVTICCTVRGAWHRLLRTILVVVLHHRGIGALRVAKKPPVAHVALSWTFKKLFLHRNAPGEAAACEKDMRFGAENTSRRVVFSA